MKLATLLLCSLALTAALSGCTVNKATTAPERKQAVLEMERDTLTQLYKVQPLARAQISAAPGYAVFSNANINVIFASFGGGYGVVTDKGGKHTFMKMGEVGVGLGIGVKDFRAVFVFHDQKALDRFINSGWTFGGNADAAAKAGDMGAAIAGEAVVDGISVYQLTESGLALQATVKGTKFWKDGDLN